MKGFALSSPQPERCSKSFSLRRIPPQRLFCTFLQKNTSSSLFFPTFHISSSRSYFFQAVTKGRRRSHSLVSPPFVQEIRQLTTHVGKKNGQGEEPDRRPLPAAIPLPKKVFRVSPDFYQKLAALTRGKEGGCGTCGRGEEGKSKVQRSTVTRGGKKPKPTQPIVRCGISMGEEGRVMGKG